MGYFSEVKSYQIISPEAGLLFVAQLNEWADLPVHPISLLKPSVLGMILSSPCSP